MSYMKLDGLSDDLKTAYDAVTLWNRLVVLLDEKDVATFGQYYISKAADGSVGQFFENQSWMPQMLKIALATPVQFTVAGNTTNPTPENPALIINNAGAGTMSLYTNYDSVVTPQINWGGQMFKEAKFSANIPNPTGSGTSTSSTGTEPYGPPAPTTAATNSFIAKAETYLPNKTNYKNWLIGGGVVAAVVVLYKIIKH